MKKLSIEEKAKRFDEILARAEGVNILYYKEDIMSKVKEFVYYLLPELKESEDEKLRKCTISLLKTARDKGFYELPKAVNKCIAWLEKQGKHDMGISEATKQELEDRLNKALEKETPESCNEFLKKQGKQRLYASETMNEKRDFDSGFTKMMENEQKPDDKVEIKFKDGDWVTSDGESIFRITIDNNMYQLETLEGTSCHFSYKIIEEKFRLWTIADAKIGDVLVSESTCGLGTWYCIFKSLDNDESMTVHCYIARDGSFQTMEELCFNKDPRNVKPATKEQRNLLFKKMHEAGYRWNIDKKKLEKNEIKIKAGRNYRCTKTHVYAGLNWFEGTKYYADEDYSLVNNRCACFCSKYSKYEHNNLFEEVE